MADKELKPPKRDAPKEEHQRFAKEVLDSDRYKKEPSGGMKPNDVPKP